MKNYQYVLKRITIKNKNNIPEIFEAHFLEKPSQHSTVKAIIWKSYNGNYDYPQNPRWFSDIYILPKNPKNSNKWKLFYSGLSKNCPIGESGLNLMLFNLETQEVQNDDIIKDAILQAKEEINNLNQQLSDARKNYRYVLSLKKQAETKKTTKNEKGM